MIAPIAIVSLAAPTPTASPAGDNLLDQWPLLVLMAFVAILLAGISVLYLVRRFGRGVFPDPRPDRRPGGPTAP
ncbi:MAG: hypothetical protein ABR518_06470 [Actinomycetota bacterium]